MKKLFSYITVALVATVALSIAAPNKDEMLSRETAAWQAYKDKKADDFKKIVGRDMIGIYADGIADMEKEMADMQKWDMKSFKISDYKTHSGGKDVVVSCYTVTLEGTFDGKDASGTYNSGSVWRQENGKWLALLHTNVKQAPGTTPDAQKKE